MINAKLVGVGEQPCFISTSWPTPLGITPEAGRLSGIFPIQAISDPAQILKDKNANPTLAFFCRDKDRRDKSVLHPSPSLLSINCLRKCPDLIPTQPNISPSMPAYKQSSNIYTETAFGLYTDLPYNPTFDFDWYSECGSEPHIDPSDSTLNASGEASTSPSLFQSIPSASPVSSLSSPERTDSDSESGDNASSSDSDSDAEGDLDQGNWTVVDNHAYLSHTFKDL